jgi:hypothetical protein
VSGAGEAGLYGLEILDNVRDQRVVCDNVHGDNRGPRMWGEEAGDARSQGGGQGMRTEEQKGHGTLWIRACGDCRGDVGGNFGITSADQLPSFSFQRENLARSRENRFFNTNRFFITPSHTPHHTTPSITHTPHDTTWTAGKNLETR